MDISNGDNTTEKNKENPNSAVNSLPRPIENGVQANGTPALKCECHSEDDKEEIQVQVLDCRLTGSLFIDTTAILLHLVGLCKPVLELWFITILGN